MLPHFSRFDTLIVCPLCDFTNDIFTSHSHHLFRLYVHQKRTLSMVIVFDPKLRYFQASTVLFPNQILFCNPRAKRYKLKTFDDLVSAYDEALLYHRVIVGPFVPTQIRVRTDLIRCCNNSGLCLGHLDRNL